MLAQMTPTMNCPWPPGLPEEWCKCTLRPEAHGRGLGGHSPLFPLLGTWSPSTRACCPPVPVASHRSSRTRCIARRPSRCDQRCELPGVPCHRRKASARRSNQPSQPPPTSVPDGEQIRTAKSSESVSSMDAYPSSLFALNPLPVPRKIFPVPMLREFG